MTTRTHYGPGLHAVPGGAEVLDTPRQPGVAGASGPQPGPVGIVAPEWDELVTRHWAQVHRLAWRLTGNREDAEDLTQETFLRVFRSLHSYRPTGRFEGWLHRITTNLFLDGARRRQRIRMEPIAEEAPLPDSSLAPEHRFEAENLDLDIQEALAALSPRLRAAVVLCDIEGLPYEEIARTLGVKLGTVQSRIHRGRRLLREALAHRDPSATRTGPASTHPETFSVPRDSAPTSREPVLVGDNG